MGRYFVEAVQQLDYTVIMGTTVFYGAFLVLMVIVVDILYGFIDPRVALRMSAVPFEPAPGDFAKVTADAPDARAGAAVAVVLAGRVATPEAQPACAVLARSS